MRNFKIIVSIIIFGILLSCSDNEKADGYGNFEATEITVSAEAKGKLKFLKAEEGQIIEKGESVGLIDTVQLHLNKLQLFASKATVASKSDGVWSQIKVLKEQLKTAEIEQERIRNMFSENAATQQQLDQANGQVDVLKNQIKNVETQNGPIINELKAIDTKIDLINDNIENSKVVNPIKGTVLTQYAEASEIVSFGKPLYKIANMEKMKLRVYVSETQLSALEIGQTVNVKIDAGEEMKDYQGSIDWISTSAEFTPKIIQTKEERVNLVYAVKIKVNNDGSLKIGMPAEMWIQNK